MVQGAIFKAQVLQSYNNLVQIVEYPTITEVFQALSNNEVDAIITDEESAKFWVVLNGTMFKLVGSGLPTGMGYGIMANKKSADLINNINKALLNMEDDGSYLKIYKYYFGKLSTPPR